MIFVVRLPFVVTWCYIDRGAVLHFRNRRTTLFTLFKYNGEKQKLLSKVRRVSDLKSYSNLHLELFLWI